MKTFHSLFYLTSIFLLSTTAFSQNPGNVGTANLTGWFKPDALPLGNVTTWTTTLSTIGPVTVTDATAPYPQATNTPVGDVSNYNTTLYFNNNTPTNHQGLSNNSSLNFLQNNTTGGQGSYFCAYYFPGGGTNNNHMMLWNNSPHGIQFRNLGANGRMAIGISPSNSVNASRDWSEGNIPTVISIKGNRSTSTSYSVFDNDLIVAPPTGGSQSSGTTGLRIGFYPGNNNSPYNGYIHEMIFYNSDLTPALTRRIHSYLAIKYGVTLDPTGGGVQGDYTATTDALLWDASAAPAYHNNIVGIGRDDNQDLLQKQSHAFDDNYRLYIDNLAATNIGNLGTITNDTAYILMGQNLESACGTIASNLEAPATIVSRMEREWRVTNTNFNQDFNWDLKVDTCQLLGSIVGPVNVNNLQLLVDTDGDFSNATIYNSGGGASGLVFTYSDGEVSVQNISTSEIPMNSSAYLTIAYNEGTTTFTGQDTICFGDSTAVTINFSSTAGPQNVDYSDGTTTTSLTNVMDGDIIYLSPSTTTNYTILNQTNFLNCCGPSTPTTFTVTVLSPPTVTAIANPASICVGDSSQLNGGGALTYTWDNGVSDGDWVLPTDTTDYTVIGSDAFGCIDSATVTLIVNTVPVVGATANVTTICVGDSVLLNGTGANSYVWDNGAQDNAYAFPTSTTTFIVTGSNGNCFDTASIQIIVNPLPLVQANIVTSPICLNDTTALFGTGANTYVWNNGVIDSVFFSPGITTLYTVTGTDLNNCQNTDTITAIVNSLPTVVANATSLVLCQNDSTQLSGSGANTYTWDNGVTDNTFDTPAATTLYTVIGADLNGCLDTTTINITVNPNPVVGATSTVSALCIGDPVTLNGTGATTYMWSGGIMDNTAFNPSTTQTYFVVGTNGFGCIDTASIQVIVNNLPPVVANASSLGVCEGDPLTLTGSGAVTYSWDNSVTNTVSFVPTVAATYTVTGTDANNCINTDMVFVDFYPIIPFTLGPDTVVCPQLPLPLVSNEIFSTYTWSNGSLAPSITINSPGTFDLTVSDLYGCTYSDQINVELGEDCFVTLFIPNAFTPDGDEHNRYFRTTGSFIKFFHIEIYDRWGKQVFISDDIDTHWDGTYGNKLCPQGIYSYVVRYAHDLNTDDKLIKTGHFNLLR